MPYFRTTIDALEGYQPGEQPSTGTDVVKLNSNENPYPASPQALAVLREIEGEELRHYPRPFADEFRSAAAEVVDVAPERILVGNGSDEILTMLFRSVTDSRRRVAYPVPTYVLYRTLAQMQDASVAEVPFDAAFTLPVRRLIEENAALTLVASPNSPSGNQATNDALAELAEGLDGVLVVDEAYVEFGTGSAVELVGQHDNVVILRTLSKSHGLAGLRLGFAIGSSQLVAGLAKVKDSYNVDAIASRVGAAAIRDTAYTKSVVDRVRASRVRLAVGLESLGFQVWPSDANFLLTRPADGAASSVYHRLKTAGIFVRYFDTPELGDKLRITVGTEAQNERLLAALGDGGGQTP